MIPAAKSENAHTAMMTTSNQSVLGSLRNTATIPPAWRASLGPSKMNCILADLPAVFTLVAPQPRSCVIFSRHTGYGGKSSPPQVETAPLTAHSVAPTRGSPNTLSATVEPLSITLRAGGMMANRDDLEALHPTTLAVLCEKLAEHSSDVRTAADAANLRTEWVLLQSLPSPSLKEERERDAKRWDLRTRMLNFLDGRDEVEFYPKR